MTDTPASADATVLAALAAACGYHDGPDCEHCVDTLNRVRDKGMTDAQILADLELFRVDHNLWADVTRLRIELERATTERVALVLTSLGMTPTVDDDPRHIIEFRPDGWTIKHPLACRPRLFDCPVNRAAETELGTKRCPAPPPGRYECRAGDGDLVGMFLLGDRVDQAEG
ncbi:DUF6085 family protein [Micromonospora tarensis]|uniref:Uncharacterized protein n=1 Tax=Micromonospora tarensis TaxID=2806100 RepID=A0ABS1YCI8_9ACTN|nr:DUF6085 family protein [Micromonospora tarensis]MBM0275118.1 hypothetical protein [Micromonospora tarensis]